MTDEYVPETFVSIPRPLWFRWERWCEINGYDPRKRLIAMMRLWSSDRTRGELEQVERADADANKG